ncbi:MAG: PhnD/SsuA/transferrin family substrate-binding protein [Candidatus Sumerlaeia bacterium]
MPLQIGYLVDGSDFIPATDDPFAGNALGDQLRNDLLAQKQLTEAMERAGMAGIVLTPISGSGEMIQLMRSGDLHVVLATAMVYGRFLQIAVNNPVPFTYEPILQSRRPGDIGQGRGRGVLRRGVVIMGPASALFSRPKYAPADLRQALANSPLAVPSLDSAAGYLFPILTLSSQYGASRPRLWFCGSDTDVVAHVVSGLAPFGACREGALAGTLAPLTKNGATSDSLRRHCRVLFQTAPFPTDPILIRDDFLPSLTDVGRELKPALREFFNEKQRLDRDLRVEDAVPRDYEKIQRALEQSGIAPHASTQPTTGTRVRPVLPMRR